VATGQRAAHVTFSISATSTLPGDAGYSPLWLVVIHDNADFGSVHDLESAGKAKVLASGAALVNCPIVFIAP
jgi:hypothetical protein